MPTDLKSSKLQSRLENCRKHYVYNLNRVSSLILLRNHECLTLFEHHGGMDADRRQALGIYLAWHLILAVPD
jgi:hypothetical protein